MVYREKIAHALEQLGVSRSYHGFWYTVDSCLLVLEEPKRLNAVTKEVYYAVAWMHNTSWNCVERDIRTVAQTIWKNTDHELFLEFCGGERKELPKARAFIEMMCDYVRRSYGEDGYCPETGRWCQEKASLQRRIAELSGVNTAE